MSKYQLNRYNGQSWDKLNPAIDWEDITNKPTNYPPTSHTHDYLPKTTYEYNKELALGSTGKVCIGKFSMYDSNVTVEISSATNTTYNGTLVIATQNINDSHGGNYVANVYGDPSGTLSSKLVVIYPTNSRIFEIYCDFPGYSKNLVHIKALGLKATPTDILTSVTTIPTTNTITINNLLIEKLDLKANKSDITSVYKAQGSIEDVSTIDANMPDGYVYNVTVDFTTNEYFVEGAGKTYPAGTNVVKVTANGSPKWDVLGGFADLSPYAKTDYVDTEIAGLQGYTNSNITIVNESINNLKTNLANKLDKTGTAFSVEKATEAKLGGIKLGYDSTELKYPVKLTDNTNQAYVEFPNSMKKNILAFLPPECIIIERSIDGGNTWAASGLSDEDKTLFFTQGKTIDFLRTTDNKNTCNSMIRITITGAHYNVPEGTAETEKYKYWNSNYIVGIYNYALVTETEVLFSSSGNRMSCYIEGALGTDSNNWVPFIQYDKLNGWPGSAYMKFSAIFGAQYTGNNYCNWRFTFRVQANDGTYNDSSLSQNGYILQLYHIYMYSNKDMYTAHNNMNKCGHLYDYDAYQNAIFPAKVEAKNFKGETAIFSGGRAYDSGDDEGIVIKQASNGFAGLCLGEPNGFRSVFYLNNSNGFWRVVTTEGNTYDVYHPKKAGTMALTNGTVYGIKCLDTRNENEVPFPTNLESFRKQALVYDFKTNSVIGLDNEGTFSGVFTMRHWQDYTGGPVSQIAFGNNGGIYHRYGKDSYSSWDKLVKQSDLTSVWSHIQDIEEQDIPAINEQLDFTLKSKLIFDGRINVTNGAAEVEIANMTPDNAQFVVFKFEDTEGYQFSHIAPDNDEGQFGLPLPGTTTANIFYQFYVNGNGYSMDMYTMSLNQNLYLRGIRVYYSETLE